VVVGTLQLELRLDGCFNLKEKRRVLRSLLERLRNDFHVAAAEVGDQDLWNSAVVGVACVTNHPPQADSVLDHLLAVVDANPEIEIVGLQRELVRPN